MSLLDKASLVQIPSGYKATKLYSVIPDTGAGDFTFARSSSGTRVNSEGLIETASVLGDELVTNGDFNTNGGWSLASGATISDGKLNLNVGSGNGAYQHITFTAQTTSKVVVVCSEYVSGALQVRAGTTSNTETISGVGTYTYYLPYASYNYVNFFSSGGFEGKIDSITVKELVENDVPRLDYSDGSCASLLLEPQRTNIVPYTEDFSQWGAINSNRTLINNTNPIDNNAYEIESSVTSSASRIYYSAIMTVGNDYSSTYLVKPSLNSPEYLGFACISNTQPDVLYDFANDQFVDFNIVGNAAKCESISMNNGWKLLKVPIHESVGNSRLNIYQGSRVGNNLYGTTGESYFIKFAQLEQGDYPTSYIPTNGSTVTRTADVCNNAGTSATFNDSEGCLFVEIAALADDLTSRVISLNDGSTSNRVIILYQTITSAIRVIVSSGGSIEFDSNTQNYDITNFNKIALKYKENDFALWINGTEVSTDTSGLTPIGLNNLEFNDANGTSNFFGKCKQLIYFNEALTDTELETLTT